MVITSSCYGMTMPGNPIKKPGDIINQIKALKEKISEHDDFCPICPYSKEYADELAQAEQLLLEAFFAYYLCDQYNTLDVISFELFLKTYHFFDRDSIRYSKFAKQYENQGMQESDISRKYAQMLDAECNAILEDCKKCSDYKQELKKQIESLQQFILDRKH